MLLHYVLTTCTGAVPLPRRQRVHRQLGGRPEGWPRRVLGHRQGLPARLMGEGRAEGRGDVRPAGGTARGAVCARRAIGAMHLHSGISQVRKFV